MLRVLHLGLGKIGLGTLDTLLKQSRALKLVAVVDTNPALAGKNLRDLLGKHAPNLKVLSSLDHALKATKPHVATMTTGSRTIDVAPTLETLIKAGVHVVSTCEELAYPQLRAKKLAAILDKKAKSKGVAILGTGVNPGFAMDAFALACTAPCARVDSIRILRSLDATKRREQLQKKVGAGMELKAVEALIRKNAIGHVGLGESVAMIAAGLGWELSAIRENFTPLVADTRLQSQFITVEPGQVRGLRMVAHGTVNGAQSHKPRIELDLTMAFAADTFDQVSITGDPSLTIRTTTGFPGDSSTVGIAVNAARLAPTLPPGLRTMLDVLQIRSLGA